MQIKRVQETGQFALILDAFWTYLRKAQDLFLERTKKVNPECKSTRGKTYYTMKTIVCYKGTDFSLSPQHMAEND